MMALASTLGASAPSASSFCSPSAVGEGSWIRQRDLLRQKKLDQEREHRHRRRDDAPCDGPGPGPAARDHLLSMLRQEESGEYVPACDYVRRGPGESFSEAVNLARPDSGRKEEQPPPRMPQEWRLKITEWTFEAVDHFDLDRDVASHALSYLDRAVADAYSRGRTLSKTSFQLVAMTSLYVAVKIHGASYTGPDAGPYPCAQLDTFVRLGRGMFPPALVEETERWLLETLRWRMNPPTASAFASYLLQLALFVPDPRQQQLADEDLLEFPPRFEVREIIVPHEDRAIVQCLFDLSRYLTEMAMCDSVLSLNCHPSVSALAAIMNACDAVEAAPGGRLPRGARESVAAAAADLGLGGRTAALVALRRDAREVEAARSRLREVCSTADIIERYPIPVAPPLSPQLVAAAIVTPGGKAGRKRRLSCDEEAAAASEVQRYSPNCVTEAP